MKKMLLMFFALMAWCMIGCSDDDNTPAGDNGDEPTQIVDSVKLFTDKYELKPTMDIKESTYAKCGDKDLQSGFTLLKDSIRFKAILKYLDEEIFPVFGADFIKSYMPRELNIADSVHYTYAETEYVFPEGGYIPEEVSTYYRRSIYGEVGTNHLTLAIQKFDKSLEMKKAWIGLIVERMMQSTKFTAPKELVDYVENKYDANNNLTGNLALTQNYYQPYASSCVYFNDVFTENYETEENVWYTYGSLLPQRYGWYEKSDMMGMGYYHKTYAEDFGDLVAFIVCTTAAQKTTFYAQYGAVKKANLDMLKWKVDFVKSYFKTYGLTLTDAVK